MLKEENNIKPYFSIREASQEDMAKIHKASISCDRREWFDLIYKHYIYFNAASQVDPDIKNTIERYGDDELKNVNIYGSILKLIGEQEVLPVEYEFSKRPNSSTFVFSPKQGLFNKRWDEKEFCVLISDTFIDHKPRFAYYTYNNSTLTLNETFSLKDALELGAPLSKYKYKYPLKVYENTNADIIATLNEENIPFDKIDDQLYKYYLNDMAKAVYNINASDMKNIERMFEEYLKHVKDIEILKNSLYWFYNENQNL